MPGSHTITHLPHQLLKSVHVAMTWLKLRESIYIYISTSHDVDFHDGGNIPLTNEQKEMIHLV